MKLTMGGRGSGKTAKLIKQSAETGIYILVKDRKRAGELFQYAKELKYIIPFPITVEEWVRSDTRFIGSCIRRDGIYVDDMEDILREFLRGLEIHEATLTTNENEVVISKEEYEKIWRNGWNEGYSEIQVDTVKKTAREIMEMIKEYYGSVSILKSISIRYGVDLGETK